MGRLICSIMIICITALVAPASGQENSPNRLKCPVCGMLVGMFADTNATIQFKGSPESFVFDGPKCMFKYFLNLKKYNPSRTRKEISSISVKDFNSTQLIDAMQAYYVIWSDTYGPMGNEPLPFGKEDDAKKFMKEHKAKKIIRFNDVDMKLINQLDNP
jgi:copper chaperone NosL